LEDDEDIGENVTDGRPKQDEDDDHDNGDQYEDEGIFNQALAFFLWSIQHDDFSIMNLINYIVQLGISYHNFRIKVK
jgi:hypothetical protein